MYRYSNGRQGRAQVTRRRGFHDHASNAAGNGRTDQGIGPASFGALRPAASLSDMDPMSSPIPKPPSAPSPWRNHNQIPEIRQK
jgi:hypothetical protein